MTDHIHITTPTSLSDDVVIEPTLRPHQLDEFIGQNKVRDGLSISIQAAGNVATRWTTFSFTVPPGSERRRSRHSWRARWASTSRPRRGRCSRNPRT